MIKNQSIFSDVKGEEIGIDVDDEDSIDTVQFKKKLRGMPLDQVSLDSLNDDMEDMLNSQLAHRVSSLKIKSGHTAAQLKGSESDKREWLDLSGQATANYMKELYKFQPVSLEKVV